MKAKEELCTTDQLEFLNYGKIGRQAVVQEGTRKKPFSKSEKTWIARRIKFSRVLGLLPLSHEAIVKSV